MIHVQVKGANSSSPRSPQPAGISPLLAYGSAVATVLVAVLLRFALDPYLGSDVPFILFFPAVAVAAFLGRARGGLLALILSLVAADFLVMHPRYSFGTTSFAQSFSLWVFLCSAGIIVALGEAMHRARDRVAILRQNAESLEKEARQIIETASEGIWILDKQGCITMANPRVCEMLGYRAEEILGRHKWDFVFKEDVLAAKALFEQRQHGLPEHTDFRFRSKSGREVWTILAARPRFDAQGTFAGALDMFTDITQRKQQEQILEGMVADRTARLRETVSELETFSYSIAHDLRAPLRAMQGLSKAVVEDYSQLLPEQGRDYLQRVAASASRLDRQILDVLTYSYLVRGELPVKTVDTARLITEILESSPDLRSNRDSIQMTGPLPLVLGNPAALSQVFSNLLSNAIKFVAPGTTPEVRVSAENDGEYARLIFEDNGIGIPSKDQHKIFALFQRLHPLDVYDGTGIGLAIVKKAAERMGGHVGLSSEPGKGSRFWVQLKISSPSAAYRGSSLPPGHEAAPLPLSSRTTSLPESSEPSHRSAGR